MLNMPIRLATKGSGNVTAENVLDNGNKVLESLARYQAVLNDNLGTILAACQNGMRLTLAIFAFSLGKLRKDFARPSSSMDRVTLCYRHARICRRGAPLMNHAWG